MLGPSRHRGALLGFRSSQAFQRVRATVSPYSCTRLTPTRIIDFAVRNLKKVYPLAVLRPCVDRARRTILCLIFEQTYLWCLFPANRARSLGTAVRDGEMSIVSHTLTLGTDQGIGLRSRRSRVQISP